MTDDQRELIIEHLRGEGLELQAWCESSMRYGERELIRVEGCDRSGFTEDIFYVIAYGKVVPIEIREGDPL